jgi:hypothetical protein
VRRDGVTSGDPLFLRASRASTAPKVVAEFGRKAESRALSAQQDRNAGMGEGINLRRKSLRCLGETRARHAVNAPKVVTTLGPSKLS